MLPYLEQGAAMAIEDACRALSRDWRECGGERIKFRRTLGCDGADGHCRDQTSSGVWSDERGRSGDWPE
jgi:hypothetical protein